ncbi:MAG: alpha-galactosidase [Clostridia bacterium]|nr:alpha-galactosidase [Clostridia bacterium]
MYEQLHIQCEHLKDGPACKEIRYVLHNPTDEPVWLEEFELFHADSLEALGVADAHCRVFRTGRHKNDMPSVAVLGRMDDAMLDALGSMTESGDRAGQDGQRHLISDHLTILGDADCWCIIAFMTGFEQLFCTEVTLSENGGFQSLSSRVLFHRYIRPGETLITETLRIAHTADPEASIRCFAHEKSQPRPSLMADPPSVFCTWYYYGLTVTEEDVMVNLRQMAAQKLPFDVFQIDEGWERTLGDWEQNDKFPTPMKEIADRIREAGYRPGIWTSPFVAKETSPLVLAHPDWVLRDKAGAPCIFPMNDTTYYVLDITHPDTLPYFTELYRHLTFDWGYTYHKLDFTRAPMIYGDADFYNKYITPARAYREAIAAIRRGMGDEAYFLMCGGLYDPIIGLVDAQRSGSDVLSMWASTINKGGKTAPFTIKQSLLRYYMNAWWHNDPDALMIRRNTTMERGLRLTYGLLNEDEVRTVVVNQLIGGGIVCSTEPLDRIDQDRLARLRHILPPMRTVVQPLSLMHSGRFPDKVRVSFPGNDRVLIALINWSDDTACPASVLLDADTLGTAYAPDAAYAVSSFFDGCWQADVPGNSTVTIGEIPPHSTALLKIERQTDKPIIVASDAHFSMGMELDGLCMEDGKYRAHRRVPACWDAHYTLLIPGDGKTVSLTLPAEER